MAGYIHLAADVNREILDDHLAIIAKDFYKRGEVIPGVPGEAATRPYFNQGSLALQTIRGLILRAVFLGLDLNIVCSGDSKTEGTGTVGSAYLQSWPDLVRRQLGAVEGFIPANSDGNNWDDRWTGSGMTRTTNRQMGVIQNAETGITRVVNFASTDPHVGATWHVHIPAGGDVSITVDGGAAQSFTIPAGNGFTAVTPTVTGTGNHTYQLTSDAAEIHVLGITPTYDGPRLKVSRVARGGSYASQWLPGANSSGRGLWDVLMLAEPDVVMMQIGTNQPANDAELNATNIGLLWDAIGGLGVPAVIVAPGGGNTSLGRFPPSLWEAHYSAAARLDFPMVNFQQVIGDFAHADALGLMADGVHESPAGYAHNAAAVLHLLGGVRDLTGSS